MEMKQQKLIDDKLEVLEMADLEKIAGGIIPSIPIPPPSHLEAL
jgi:hypothetical protein